MSHRVARLCVVAVFLYCGCTLYVSPGREQCSTTSDCINHGFVNTTCANSVCQQPDPWACLRSVPSPTGNSSTVTATLNLVDLISGAPMANVEGRVCRKLDVDCSDPLSTGLSSGDNGKLSVHASNGFDGYVELTLPGAMSGLYFFDPALTSDRDIPAVPIVTQATLVRFARLAGVEAAPDLSAVFLGAHNCLDEPAANVRFTSIDADDATTTFYLIQKLPSTSATATDSEGRGGFINLRAGSITVSGQLSTGETVGTVSLFTRENQVTYASLVPSP